MLWFGKKESTKETNPSAAPTPAPAVAPSATTPPPAPLETRPAPPPLPSAEKSITLKPATNLVRPQANQKVLYYQLMNGLYDAVLILDENGHIVDANERVESILGYQRDDMWDMPVADVVKGLGPQIFLQMKDAIHNGHPVLINAKCTRKDGTVFPGEVGAALINLTRGENLVITIRNIEKRLAAAAAKTNAHPAKDGARVVLKAVNRPQQ